MFTLGLYTHVYKLRINSCVQRKESRVTDWAAQCGYFWSRVNSSFNTDLVLLNLFHVIAMCGCFYFSLEFFTYSIHWQQHNTKMFHSRYRYSRRRHQTTLAMHAATTISALRALLPSLAPSQLVPS